MAITAWRDVSAPTSGTSAETWSRRLRRFLLARRCPAPSWLLEGLTLRHRRPAAQPLEALADLDGVVLLLDHEHPDAMEALQTFRATHPLSFDSGTIVVGIENLPATPAQALVLYRRAAHAPVFAVDLGRPSDRLLLWEALVATRVAAGLFRDARCASRHQAALAPVSSGA